MNTEYTDNRPKILLIVTCVVLVIAIVLVILVLGFKYWWKPLPERLSGTYSISLSAGSFAGSGSYTFEGDKATETYTKDGEIVVNEYVYEIITESAGNKVIRFTTLDENGNVVTATNHNFYTGTYTDAQNKVTKNFISINGEHYYEVTD